MDGYEYYLVVFRYFQLTSQKAFNLKIENIHIQCIH